VPRGVGVDPQRLLRVIRAVIQQPGAEREHPLVTLFAELGIPVTAIRLGGGGARGDLWRRIQAGVYGKAVEVLAAEEGGAFGCALMAGVGVGHWKNLDEACAQAIHVAERIDPDPAVVVSPCDAIVGAMGRVAAGSVHQAKGYPYTLTDLLDDDELVASYLAGSYVTLRLTSAMYHRFHAPYDCRVQQVTYISGDTWNVNPIALKRIERLFCKNERAVIRTRLVTGEALTLVPVAAILVASIRLHFLDLVLNAQSRGPTLFPCDVGVRKGDELGWFEHGSTIIVLAPDHFEFCDNVKDAARIRAGQPLLQRPAETP